MTRMDRRALFTSGAAAALLSASGLSLDAAPRAGGCLRLAVPRDDDSLAVVARGAVFDTLTEIAPDGVLRGELATRWHGSADARVWLFDLRDDVVFHDGRTFSAQDVAASFVAADGPALADVAAVEAISPLQLRLELKAGTPDLPYLLANPALIVAPGGKIDQPLPEAVGTGRYRVERAQPGRQFLGRKVDGHYKDGRAGWADSIEVIVIPDAAVRAEALRDGYVDVAALPLPGGLLGRGDFVFHPSVQDMALAAHRGVGVPRVIGTQTALDDGRIAERWWKGRVHPLQTQPTPSI
ncbi:MAG: peptide/nickel transport system substrate-binding protein [Paracoccaceae bacterium]|jgi:peptide/nickel transport system substrate-binding protein